MTYSQKLTLTVAVTLYDPGALYVPGIAEHTAHPTNPTNFTRATK